MANSARYTLEFKSESTYPKFLKWIVCPPQIPLQWGRNGRKPESEAFHQNGWVEAKGASLSCPARVNCSITCSPAQFVQLALIFSRWTLMGSIYPPSCRIFISMIWPFCNPNLSLFPSLGLSLSHQNLGTLISEHYFGPVCWNSGSAVGHWWLHLRAAGGRGEAWAQYPLSSRSCLKEWRFIWKKWVHSTMSRHEIHVSFAFWLCSLEHVI